MASTFVLRMKRQTSKLQNKQVSERNATPAKQTVTISTQNAWQFMASTVLAAEGHFSSPHRKHRHTRRDERWRDYRHPHLSCWHGSPHLNVPLSAGIVSSRRYWTPQKKERETQMRRQCLREKLTLVWQLEVIRQRPPLALGNQWSAAVSSAEG